MKIKIFPIEILSGRVGDICFRQVNGRTIACKRPDRSNTKLTENQKKQRSKFTDAIAWAKEQLTDPAVKDRYEKEAKVKKLPNAYTAAIKYYFKHVNNKPL
jgi:hypothetical protein